ncbi:hypothetical protein ACFL7E_03695 [Thermodesulfobacteriota bacterium]
MPDTPLFSYFLPGQTHPLDKESDIWNAPLPLDRKQSVGHPERKTGLSTTYGVYFNSVRSFLEKNRFEIITSAVSQMLNRNVTPDEIKGIRICLEKHGEFYHPARVAVDVCGKSVSFVVNVAVSHTWKDVVQREYRLIQRLNIDFPRTFLPEVYAQGEIPIEGSDVTLGMFLGEWFEGFNEFHLSIDKADGKQKLLIWDPVQGNSFLSEDQAKTLYNRAAMILTCYYDIETFEHISLWHHAAGDFVVKLQDGKIDLKLITVRRYAPMFGEIEAQEEASASQLMLEALLVFFLNLTLRMRLDRLDGIGDMTWADNVAVEGALDGFFRGLAMKAEDGIIPEPFVGFFQHYLSRCTQADLLDLSVSIANKFNPLAPEIAVINENLKAHTTVLFSAIQKYAQNDGS